MANLNAAEATEARNQNTTTPLIATDCSDDSTQRDSTEKDLKAAPRLAWYGIVACVLALSIAIAFSGK